MGRDKALLPFRALSLIEHAVRRLRAAGCDTFIAGSRPDLEKYAPVLPDLHPGCGPLSGIEAALAVAPSSTSVLFLAIDLPLLPVCFLTLLLERVRRTGALMTVPVFGGKPQPLCAIYSAALLPGITAALEAGEYKVMRVLEALVPPRGRDLFAVEAVLSAEDSLRDRASDPSHRWFTNVNTPEELVGLNA